jgi:nuclear GTP-binding protein
VWQYITLMRRIYLIDCPGIVPPSATDTAEDILLHGVVRVENVENPEQYIPAVLAKCKPQHIERTYEIRGYKNHIEFLEILARKGGRLLKGGEPDLDGVAKMVLNDFIRGKLPWFTPVPKLAEGEEDDDLEAAGRTGALGEMRKRKAEDEGDVVGEQGPTDDEDDEEEWGGIQSEDDDAEDSDAEGTDVESEAGSTEGAPTLVADDSSDDEEEEPVKPVKPLPASQRKRRKGN